MATPKGVVFLCYNIAMIISHEDEAYRPFCENGAHIYSELICKFFIPNIKTDRNWVTINIGKCCDHSIVFIHSNLNTVKKYGFIKNYKDLILVCSQFSTMKAVQNFGKAIYLPLSIDTQYVEKFRKLNHEKRSCYAGRRGKVNVHIMKENRIDLLCDLPHEELLTKMADYKYVYAVGLTALEAMCLNCNILPYDIRFPDVRVWKLKDIRTMIPILQQKLDECDKIET